MKYRINVTTINILTVDATSEEEAIKIVKNQLISSKQLKEND